MNTWKKALALLLALVMVLALAVGCEKDDDDKDDEKSSSSSDKDKDDDEEDDDKEDDDKEDDEDEDPSDPSTPSQPAPSNPEVPTPSNPEVPTPSTPSAPNVPNVPAGDAEAAVAEFVRVNGPGLLASFEEGFTSQRLTCETEIEASGTGFIMAIAINELENVSDADKATMQASYDAQQAIWDAMLAECQAEEPAITYFVMFICDKNAEPLAIIAAGDVDLG